MRTGRGASGSRLNEASASDGERLRKPRSRGERERERRRDLSPDFERRSDDPRRLASLSALERPLSRDLGRLSPSFSFESVFFATSRSRLARERERLSGRRLRRSSPLLDDDDDDELLLLDDEEDDEELELELKNY